MTKSRAAAVLKQLREVNFLLRAQAQEIANLRATTDIQFKRIAEMQADLDVLPIARLPKPPGSPDEETLDFDSWASGLASGIGADPRPEARPTHVRDLARFLRTAWHARGALDVGSLESELREILRATAAGSYINDLDPRCRQMPEHA
jgi:hypothetical protein